MASGFFALLDDIATIAKIAATSVDDIAGQAVSVLDDAATQAAKETQHAGSAATHAGRSKLGKL